MVVRRVAALLSVLGLAATEDHLADIVSAVLQEEEGRLWLSEHSATVTVHEYNVPAEADDSECQDNVLVDPNKPVRGYTIRISRCTRNADGSREVYEASIEVWREFSAVTAVWKCILPVFVLALAPGSCSVALPIRGAVAVMGLVSVAALEHFVAAEPSRLLETVRLLY
eukprot:TRINITY_DN13764_c0_g1_i1.p1 TRINITY_DN13764_c0_g1~~TRINITY_DN13764_c0_g1_i1.p1  ORF type:complete len:169 (+),score=21.09 TRINITY_DN13764_c0_g1_i1:53-559(+)